MFLHGKLLLALAICLTSSSSFITQTEAWYPGNAPGQLVQLVYPPYDVQIQEFSYIPTPEGYRYSYTLSDGMHHEEHANIVDPNSPEAAAYIASANERRNRPRPRGGAKKNRKLSPKSLQSLAG